VSDSIWESTLAGFGDQLASRDPVPAGVSLAAVSASLALSLLVKVLEITGRRRDFKGDPERLEELLTAARTESAKLARLAGEDIVAYADYMASRKSPAEPIALRRAIEVPLDAARAAAAGLKLCEEASAIAPSSVAPDVGTAELLLSAAIRGMLLSVKSNASRLGDTEFQREIAALTELAKNHQRW